MLGPYNSFTQNVSNYHFDSFPYENSYEEDEYEDHYKEMAFYQKWGSKYSNQVKELKKTMSSPSMLTSSGSNLFSSSSNSTSSKRQKFKKILKNFILPNRFNPLKRETFISILPVEIVVEIVGNLSYKDVLNVSLVCTEWFYLAQEEILWRSVYQTYFVYHPNRELALSKPQNHSDQHWREIFKEHHFREAKWSGDRYQESHLIGHTGTVWALHMDAERVYTGSFDKTAKVWDINTKKCKYTLSGHYYPIQCLDVIDNTMITGSLDNSIRVWDLEEGKSKGILTTRAHNFDVFCLQSQDNLIFSGSSDSTVKIWNISNILESSQTPLDELLENDLLQEEEQRRQQYQQLQQEHQNNQQQFPDDVSSLMDPFDVGSMISEEGGNGTSSHINIVSSNDRTSRRYLNHNMQSVETFKHTSCVTCLQVKDNILMSGGSDKVVRVWDLNTSQSIDVLEGHHEGIRALQFNGNVLVTGSDDTTVKIWDLRHKNHCVSTLRGHTGAIRCLQWEGATLITGSNDQTIRYWNMNSGSQSSRELFSFSSSISCLRFTENVLMCGLSDSKVQITKFY
ncbi:hypothetical protein CYY_004875 [Polysphondylium violaceum]|uniref:F-box domain-containing protein n=1 Tax=Polysphondylium violaceum TaxID=133409 RepID=A0A8J4V4R4_9MYCE|nr:hypothetical protein CYY_004875 [Polysphondylium violaceum]